MREVKLDQEWVQLIAEARKIGIQKEAISLFLKETITMNHLVQTNTERKIHK